MDYYTTHISLHKGCDLDGAFHTLGADYRNIPLTGDYQLELSSLCIYFIYQNHLASLTSEFSAILDRLMCSR